MTKSRIVLVDGDEHTAGLLVAELARRGFGYAAAKAALQRQAELVDEDEGA